MQLLTLDWETFYDKDYSLSKMTTQEYILDKRFQEIMVGVKTKDQPGEWFSGTRDETREFLAQFDWANIALVCQNTMFDAAILAWHYDIHPKLLLDTLAMSRALYPHEKSHSLAAQAKREGIGEKGTEVLNALGKRREDFSPEELNKYGIYCVNDCDLEEVLALRYLPRVPPKEIQLIDSTLRMYTEPAFECDKAELELHLDMVKRAKAETIEEVRQIVDPTASDQDLKALLASSAKFASLLEQFGVEPPTKKSPTAVDSEGNPKTVFAFAKTDEAFKELEQHEDTRVQALVAARLGEKSTIEESRTERLIRCAELAPLVPIALRYYGAWTGRWSADSAGATNFQNMPRKSRMKRAIRAPEGYVICGADLSNIELRLGLWLAGQDNKVQLVRDGLDLYKDLASRVNGIPYAEIPDDMRQTFKVVNLSAIYQTGGGRLQQTLRIMAKQKVSLEYAKELIGAYRQDNPMVVRAWEDCEQALRAIARQDPVVPSLFRGLVTWDWKVQGWLLPSGLHLQLKNLREQLNEKTGYPEFVFDTSNGPAHTYGGKLFQGLTQAIARVIIAEGWLRINKRYKVKLSIHDSLYWLAPIEEAQEALDWGMEQMTAPISWCEDMPLGVEGGFGKTLKDIK